MRERCGRVELWVTGHYWVKFSSEPEPVKKAYLSCKMCEEEATCTGITPEGFVFRECATHAADPICGAVV